MSSVQVSLRVTLGILIQLSPSRTMSPVVPYPSHSFAPPQTSNFDQHRELFSHWAAQPTRQLELHFVRRYANFSQAKARAVPTTSAPNDNTMLSMINACAPTGFYAVMGACLGVTTLVCLIAAVILSRRRTTGSRSPCLNEAERPSLRIDPNFRPCSYVCNQYPRMFCTHSGPSHCTPSTSAQSAVQKIMTTEELVTPSAGTPLHASTSAASPIESIQIQNTTLGEEGRPPSYSTYEESLESEPPRHDVAEVSVSEPIQASRVIINNPMLKPETYLEYVDFNATEPT